MNFVKDSELNSATTDVSVFGDAIECEVFFVGVYTFRGDVVHGRGSGTPRENVGSQASAEMFGHGLMTVTIRTGFAA